MLEFFVTLAAAQVAARFRVADVSGAGVPRLRLQLGGQECVSDADGLVVAPPLAQGAYRVAVLSTSDGPGVRFLQPRSSLVVNELSAAEYADPAAYPTVTVYRASELRVLVVDSADSALSGFKVVLKNGDDELQSASTDEQGYATFSLSEEGAFRAEGTYGLEVEDLGNRYSQNTNGLTVKFSTSFTKVVMTKSSDTGKAPSLIGVLAQPVTKQVVVFFDRELKSATGSSTLSTKLFSLDSVTWRSATLSAAHANAVELVASAGELTNAKTLQYVPNVDTSN